MIAKVNINRAASDLAHVDLERKAIYKTTFPPNNKEDLQKYIDEILWEEPETCLQYKPEWQEEFDSYYDYYFNTISKCIIK